eukprot:4523920-Prymnesium_polylepis.2
MPPSFRAPWMMSKKRCKWSSDHSRIVWIIVTTSYLEVKLKLSFSRSTGSVSTRPLSPACGVGKYRM